MEKDKPLEANDSALLREELHQLLYTLDTKIRTILILCFFEKRKLKELLIMISSAQHPKATALLGIERFTYTDAG